MNTLNFTIEVDTDHKPLEAILKKLLYQAPGQLHKMILTVQKYTINLIYYLGKKLVTADTLSIRESFPTNSDKSPDREFEVNLIYKLPVFYAKSHTSNFTTAYETC